MPIYIFYIILRAAVIADYRIIMAILNIIIGAWTSPHSPTLTSLHLRHSLFSNPSAALPTSQLILQPFRCFTYVTAHYPTLPPLHLRHSSFYNPSAASPTSQVILNVSVASPTSQALHVLHLAGRPCIEGCGGPACY